ncbi:hypothetical protein BJ508DRAFT_315194 [Ascobolus immersus RN42]|uniref:Uncharacterized protein n=1 Tax=Ascobolus immersus RN42 TaxID=1160509 RepID=A0A3N4HE70_ASCIM|nr:hypothetical protein BJ508DRAFT_315194 [Ascobolus immersus RN42]
MKQSDVYTENRGSVEFMSSTVPDSQPSDDEQSTHGESVIFVRQSTTRYIADEREENQHRWAPESESGCSSGVLSRSEGRENNVAAYTEGVAVSSPCGTLKRAYGGKKLPCLDTCTRSGLGTTANAVFLEVETVTDTISKRKCAAVPAPTSSRSKMSRGCHGLASRTTSTCDGTIGNAVCGECDGDDYAVCEDVGKRKGTPERWTSSDDPLICRSGMGTIEQRSVDLGVINPDGTMARRSGLHPARSTTHRMSKSGSFRYFGSRRQPVAEELGHPTEGDGIRAIFITTDDLFKHMSAPRRPIPDLEVEGKAILKRDSVGVRRVLVVSDNMEPIAWIHGRQEYLLKSLIKEGYSVRVVVTWVYSKLVADEWRNSIRVWKGRAFWVCGESVSHLDG